VSHYPHPKVHAGDAFGSMQLEERPSTGAAETSSHPYCFPRRCTSRGANALLKLGGHQLTLSNEKANVAWGCAC
jgi:hypothetical protein